MRYNYHKFKAKPVNDDGNKFQSTIEWKYFKHLQLMQKSGEVLFFLRQVPFYLPGGTKYVVDYQIFTSDGRVRFVDVKGMSTPLFETKKRIVESIYPVEIEIVKKEDF
jgi:hypothetical protein